MSLLLSSVNGERRLKQWIYAKDEANNVDDGEGNNFDQPQPVEYNNNGGDIIQVSANAVYVIAGLIVRELLVGCSCCGLFMFFICANNRWFVLNGSVYVSCGVRRSCGVCL